MSSITKAASICSWPQKFYDTIRPMNPVTGSRQFRFIPKGAEIGFGNYFYHGVVQEQGGICRNPVYTEHRDLLQKVTGRLVHHADRKLPYEAILTDTGVENAGCLPGGKIVFCRGLIESMQAETRDFGLGYIPLEDKVAAVMSHEMVHAGARHGARTLEMTLCLSVLIYVASQVAALAFAIFFVHYLRDPIFLGYSRSNELESDRHGMKLMQRAGYDPKAALWVMHLFSTTHPRTGIKWFDQIILYPMDKILSTHPAPDDRIQHAEKTLALLASGKLK